MEHVSYCLIGASQCRKRRKKCDEHRPVCGGCNFTGYSCIWPSRESSSPVSAGIVIAQNVQNRLIRRASATLTRGVSSGYQPFRDQTQFSLTIGAVPAILPFLRKPIPTEACDLSLITTCAFKEEWLRDALSAFSAVFHSRSKAELGNLAFIYYHRSCVALRNSLDLSSGASHLDDPSTTIASVFLGLFEVRTH